MPHTRAHLQAAPRQPPHVQRRIHLHLVAGGQHHHGALERAVAALGASQLDLGGAGAWGRG
jgi:hypothetical protein